MSKRIVFGSGVLIGSVFGSIFSNKFGKLGTSEAEDTFGEGKIHVEYIENPVSDVQKSRFKEIVKYGCPERAPEVSCYSNHVLSYDQATRTPLWVAEHLTKQNIKGDANRRHSKFKPDPSVPAMFSAHNSDYWKSGWSRGHMAPAGDNKVSQCAMNETFYLSNILPQDLDNNAGFWNRFEMYCRDLTERYQNVRVVSGPVLLPEKGEDDKSYIKYQVLGSSEVAVPTHLYKVIVTDNDSEPPCLAAFIVPNKPISFAHDLTEYQAPLETLERRTGIKFVPKLDRSKTDDLCVKDGCKLKTKEEFDLYIICRKMSSAKTQEKLDKVWAEFKDKELTPDKYAIDLYNKKKGHFLKESEE